MGFTILMLAFVCPLYSYCCYICFLKIQQIVAGGLENFARSKLILGTFVAMCYIFKIPDVCKLEGLNTESFCYRIIKFLGVYGFFGGACSCSFIINFWILFLFFPRPQKITIGKCLKRCLTMGRGRTNLKLTPAKSHLAISCLLPFCDVVFFFYPSINLKVRK